MDKEAVDIAIAEMERCETDRVFIMGMAHWNVQLTARAEHERTQRVMKRYKQQGQGESAS